MIGAHILEVFYTFFNHKLSSNVHPHLISTLSVLFPPPSMFFSVSSVGFCQNVPPGYPCQLRLDTVHSVLPNCLLLRALNTYNTNIFL